MNTIDIIIITVVFYLIYIMVLVKPKSETFNNSCRKKNKLNKLKKKKYCDSDLDYYLSVLNKNKNDNKHNKNKLQFTEIQFHNDYRDILTGISKISEHKQLFNTSDKPIENTNPHKKKVIKLVKYFINELNKVIKDDSSLTLNCNSGWNDARPMDNVKSGWEKHMESLGLPSSLYKPPASKSKLKLLDIKNMFATESEDDMRITCIILCKKKHINDQILLKVNFWVDKRDINNDRDFFKDNEDTMSIEDDDELKVVIEEIFILGFFVKDTGSGDSSGRSKKDFYHFDNIEKDGMMDQEEILKQLMKKHRDRALETNTRICSLDAENKQIQEQTPHLTNYEAYKNTRTIFDDVNGKKEFSTFNNDF